MAPYGPQTLNMWVHPRSSGSPGRRVPSDARTPLLTLSVELAVMLTPPFSHIARRARRSPSKTRRCFVLVRLIDLASSRPSARIRKSSVRTSPLLPAHHHTFPSTTTNQTKKNRLTRVTATQELSRLNQKIFHPPDGPDQWARDDAMRTAMAAELEGKPIPDRNPNQWADRTKSRI